MSIATDVKVQSLEQQVKAQAVAVAAMRERVEEILRRIAELERKRGK